VTARVPKNRALERRSPSALTVIAPANVGEIDDLAAVLARDDAAWRRFVGRYDSPLRVVVRHASEATRPLTDDQVDDVLGDFWGALVANDMRLLRAFNPTRGATLLTWLTFQVAHVAYEHLRRLGEEPTWVPLHEARNVPAPRPRSPRLRNEVSSVDEAIRAAVRDAVTTELRNAIGSVQSNAQSTSEGYISIAKAAEVADTHPATIRAWIRSGRLAAGRTGRHYKVLRSDVMKLISSTLKSETTVDAQKRIAEIIAADREG
jgi:excisionase family DNA binding protein